MLKYLFLLLVFYATNGFAQSAAPVQLSHYVFSSFIKGKVLQKSGVLTEQSLNYNALTGEMIFDAGGKYLAIAEPGNVDTVFIAERRFVPVDAKFYEVLTRVGAPLFVEYTCTIDDPGASVGFGATSNTTASTALKTFIGSGAAYELKLPDDFKVKPVYTYWILKDGSFHKANNAQQLGKIFPERKSRLNALLKTNHTDFSKREELIALVEQLQQ